MGIIAIACYRPNQGNERKLLAAVRNNTPLLFSLGLITSRLPIIMKATDGTILEIFEWASRSAKSTAHKNPDVMGLWALMMALGKNVPLKSIPEAKEIFANFKPI
jgi:hypothetical protein